MINPSICRRFAGLPSKIRGDILVSAKFSGKLNHPKSKSSSSKHLMQGTIFGRWISSFSLGGGRDVLESVTYVGKAEIPILASTRGGWDFWQPLVARKLRKRLKSLFKGNYRIGQPRPVEVDFKAQAFLATSILR